MNSDEMTLLVQRYFGAVDAQDLGEVLATLTPDCRFSVETHGVVLNGHAEITGMFQRLWGAHAAVCTTSSSMYRTQLASGSPAGFR